MATRIVEWKKPYTWGDAINIDEDKVISLRLRGENNLIIYDEWDDEIYVDLQLEDWIEPTDAFPVGITTGRVLVADWWDVTWTLINAKTTSWDNIQLLYADDGTLWIDNGTGTFKQIYLKWDIDTIVSTLTDYIDAHDTVVSDTAPSDPYEWQLRYDTANDQLKVYDGTQWQVVGSWWWGGSTTISVTLLANWWSNDEQTVTATGVTSSNSVIISPDPSDMSDYTDAGIYCTTQWTDSLTFTCDTTPSNDIDVNVVILS